MTRKERDERERMLIEDGITNLLDDLVYNNKISKETAEGMMKSLGKSGRLPGLLFRHAKKTTPSAFVAKTDIIERRGTAAKVMKQVDGIPFPDAPKPVRKPKNGLEAAFGGVSS